MFGSYRSLQKKSLFSLAMAGSGSGCVGFIYNSNTNKSVFPLKLTETVIRQIEGFLNNKRAPKQPASITFDNQAGGVISFPATPSSSSRQFVFTAQSHTERHSELKAVVKSDNQFYNVGTIRGSLRVCADDESFNNAKVKFNSVKALNEQNCTKVYKQNDVLSRRPGHPAGGLGVGLGAGGGKGGGGVCGGEPNDKLADKPLRERVVHLLAPGNRDRIKLMSKLRSGLNAEDGRLVSSVVNAVATNAGRNLYCLRRSVWSEVKEDWPFFTDDERRNAIANKRKYMQLEEDENSRSPSGDDYAAGGAGGGGIGRGGAAGRGIKRTQAFIDPTAKKSKLGAGARAIYSGTAPTQNSSSSLNGYNNSYSSQPTSSSTSTASSRALTASNNSSSLGTRATTAPGPINSHLPSHNSLTSNSVGGHHSPGSSHSSHLSTSNNIVNNNGSHNSSNSNSKASKGSSHNNGSLLSVPSASSNNSHQRSNSIKYRAGSGTVAPPSLTNGGGLPNGAGLLRTPVLEDSGSSHSSYLRAATCSPGSRSASVSPMAASPAQNSAYGNGQQQHSRNPSPMDHQLGGGGSSTSGLGYRKTSPPTVNGMSGGNGSSVQGNNYNVSPANGRRSSSKSPPDASTRISYGSGRNHLVNGVGPPPQLGHKSNGVSGGISTATKSVSPYRNTSNTKTNHHQYNNNIGGHHGQNGCSPPTLTTTNANAYGSTAAATARLSPGYSQLNSSRPQSSSSSSNNSNHQLSPSSSSGHGQRRSPPAPTTNGLLTVGSPPSAVASTSSADAVVSASTSKIDNEISTDMSSYGGISSLAQRRTYRLNFENLYIEYKRLFKEMQVSRETFQTYSNSTNQFQEGTPEHEAALNKAQAAYSEMFPNFKRLILRYDLLVSVLSHIKMRVKEYDDLLDSDPVLQSEHRQANRGLDTDTSFQEEEEEEEDEAANAKSQERPSSRNSGPSNNIIISSSSCTSSSRQAPCLSPPSSAPNGAADATVNGSYMARSNGNLHQQRHHSRSDRQHQRSPSSRYNQFDHNGSSKINSDHHQQSSRRSHSRNGNNTTSSNNGNNGGFPNR